MRLTSFESITMTSPLLLTQFHYRFSELKDSHGIEDEKPSSGAAGPQKMASGLLCMSFRF